MNVKLLLANKGTWFIYIYTLWYLWYLLYLLIGIIRYPDRLLIGLLEILPALVHLCRLWMWTCCVWHVIARFICLQLLLWCTAVTVLCSCYCGVQLFLWCTAVTVICTCYCGVSHHCKSQKYLKFLYL